MRSNPGWNPGANEKHGDLPLIPFADEMLLHSR